MSVAEVVLVAALVQTSFAPCAILRCQELSAGVPQAAHLRGVVTDVNDWRVSDAKVTIEGMGKTYTVTTSRDGEYSAELPPGVYQIKASSVGYCPIRRSAFRLAPSADAVLDLTLILCGFETALTIEGGRYTGEVEGYRIPFKEESFQVAPPLELLIQYGGRAENGDSIIYKAITAEGKDIGVILSYNLLTVRADTVCLNKGDFHVKAVGNVVIDNEGEKVKARQAEINFKSDQPAINVSK